MDKLKREHSSDDGKTEGEPVSKAIKTKPSGKKVKNRCRRQYNINYLKFGFHWTGNEEKPLPLCIVCDEKMSNESMVPSKLKRHFTTKHSHLQDKDMNYFQKLFLELESKPRNCSKKEQQSKQKKCIKKELTVSEKAQIASFEIAEMIATQAISHSLAESVIMPACRRIVKAMFGEAAEKEVSKIPLSNSTMHRRIMELSADIEENIQSRLQNSEFALQVQESTDIGKKTHLIAFARFVDGSQIINQFFCCKEISPTAGGQDIFYILSAYLENLNLSWKSCAGICTDGAPSMTGSMKDFVSLVQLQNPNVIRTHCFLDREVLVSSTLPVQLKEVLTQVVEILNYVKSRPLKSRLFEHICVDMDSQHKRLVLQTEGRWLSRVDVLRRVHELNRELLAFFEEEKHERFCGYLRCEFWVSKLEYLTEIFAQLNIIYTSLQSKDENILSSTDKLVSFKKKVVIWKNRAVDGNFEMFPLIRNSCISTMTPIILEHLTILEGVINVYFPSLNTEEFDWVRNPFIEIPSNIGLKFWEEMELATLSSDRGLKIKHSELPIDAFWIAIKEDYPSVAKKALSVLMQFSSSHLCELGFATLNNITKKGEKRRYVEEEMRVCLSQIRPNFENIGKKHQAQISH